jgi:hypothetical protein
MAHANGRGRHPDMDRPGGPPVGAYPSRKYAIQKIASVNWELYLPPLDTTIPRV